VWFVVLKTLLGKTARHTIVALTFTIQTLYAIEAFVAA